MQDKTRIRAGWVFLIIVFLMAVRVPPLLLLAAFIVIAFQVPRCMWDWIDVNMLGKGKIDRKGE